MTILANIIARVRLVKAFRLADLAIKHTTINGEVIRKFPTIHSVKFFDERTEFVFTVPNGLDPKNVRKQSYVFRQVFGRSTELRGDLKRFVLNVYQRSIPREVTYDYDAITSAIEGLALPIIAGKDVRGKYVAYDMAHYPHLLIAGETGAGKSTQLRAILTTLIRAKNPDDLRLVLADMKRSEFHLFRNIAHVDSISTDVDSLQSALKGVAKELTDRGDMLDRHEVTHIHELPGGVRRPDIIVCIDEVALLKREKDVMSIIEDVSAIGRALGVYLILSMQRPDADVLDGKLKNNLTVRMAFRHSSAINSRITIDESGAEYIPIDRRGRMLLKVERLREIQAPFLDVDKARKLLDQFRTKSKPKEIMPAPAEHLPLFGQLGGDNDA